MYVSLSLPWSQIQKAVRDIFTYMYMCVFVSVSVNMDTWSRIKRPNPESWNTYLRIYARICLRLCVCETWSRIIIEFRKLSRSRSRSRVRVPHMKYGGGAFLKLECPRLSKSSVTVTVIHTDTHTHTHTHTQKCWSPALHDGFIYLYSKYFDKARHKQLSCFHVGLLL